MWLLSECLNDDCVEEGSWLREPFGAREKLEWLRSISIFANLTDAELAEVARLVHERPAGKGHHVFYEGQPRDAVYFLRSGLVKVFKIDEDGREQIISYLQTGDMFPHVGFFADGPYPGTAQAMEDSSLASIGLREFEKLLIRQPQMAITVMRVLGQKILELQQKLQDVTQQSAADRIARALAHLCVRYGEKDGEGIQLSVRLTNRELAGMVGTSRETVNRVLSDLRRQHFIKISQDRIWVSTSFIHKYVEHL